MVVSPNWISPQSLIAAIGTPRCPLLIDVRRAEAYAADDRIVPTAAWRDHRAAAVWDTGPRPAARPTAGRRRGRNRNRNRARPHE